MNERYSVWASRPREDAEAEEIGTANSFAAAKDVGTKHHTVDPAAWVSILGEHGASWTLIDGVRWRRVTTNQY